MEATVRGQIEKSIETITETEQLAQIAVGFRQRFPIKSVEDCVFGFIVGSLLSSYTAFMTMAGRTSLTDEEVNEFWDIIERRTLEIKGKIKLALGK